MVSEVEPLRHSGMIRQNEMVSIILGGSGGQGVVSLGKLLAVAAMNEDLAVSCYPIYGAEMRGGYAFSTVIIAETEIPSPIVSRADAGVFLDSFAYDYLAPMVAEDGLLVVNSGLVKPKPEKTRRLFCLNVDRAAQELGDGRCANMVAAGFLAQLAWAGQPAVKPFPKLETLRKTLEVIFPDKPALVGLNRQALSAGYELKPEKDAGAGQNQQVR